MVWMRPQKFMCWELCWEMGLWEVIGSFMNGLIHSWINGWIRECVSYHKSESVVKTNLFAPIKAQRKKKRKASLAISPEPPGQVMPCTSLGLYRVPTSKKALARWSPLTLDFPDFRIVKNTFLFFIKYPVSGIQSLKQKNRHWGKTYLKRTLPFHSLYGNYCISTSWFSCFSL